MTTKIHANARRWFSRDGNTYHSVRVTMREIDVTVPFEYGYGDHFMVTAGKALIEAPTDSEVGNVAFRESLADFSHGSDPAYGFGRRWAEAFGFEIVVDVVDVPRRKDLHNGGKS